MNLICISLSLLSLCSTTEMTARKMKEHLLKNTGALTAVKKDESDEDVTPSQQASPSSDALSVYEVKFLGTVPVAKGTSLVPSSTHTHTFNRHSVVPIIQLHLSLSMYCLTHLLTSCLVCLVFLLCHGGAQGLRGMPSLSRR